MKIWQPGSHLSEERGAAVRDWSWKRTRRRLGLLGRLTLPYRGRTTIIIAHRLSTIALADEIVVLDHGRIAARGTQAELLATNAVYQEIHEHGLLQGLLKESA